MKCIETLIAGSLASLLLAVPAIAAASEIATSNLTVTNLAITPAVGSSISLLMDWDIQALTEARNSLGELDQQAEYSALGGLVAADAVVTWAHGGASVLAPLTSPPVLDVTEGASSRADVPGEPACCPEKWAYAMGDGTAINGLIVTGGSGSVAVDFSAVLGSSMSVSTDSCPVAHAWTELIFVLEIFDTLPEIGGLPQDQIVLYQSKRLTCDGPNCNHSDALDQPPTARRYLDFDVPYYFVLQVDSESRAGVPAPPSALLLLAGLGALVRRHRLRFPGHPCA